MDLALNNLQRLICHKTQTNKFDETPVVLHIRKISKTVVLLADAVLCHTHNTSFCEGAGLSILCKV